MTGIGKDQRGSVAIIVALSLLILLGFGALAVDLGYVMLVKNELQNAADAGALAEQAIFMILTTEALIPALTRQHMIRLQQTRARKRPFFLTIPTEMMFREVTGVLLQGPLLQTPQQHRWICGIRLPPNLMRTLISSMQLEYVQEHSQQSRHSFQESGEGHLPLPELRLLHTSGLPDHCNLRT